jgi:hypothetical protein
MSSNSSWQDYTGTQPKEGLQRRELLMSAGALVATGAIAATGLGLPVLGDAFGPGMAALAAEKGPPPHIIYIVSDDQGWKDVGFHGSVTRCQSVGAIHSARREACVIWVASLTLWYRMCAVRVDRQ